MELSGRDKFICEVCLQGDVHFRTKELLIRYYQSGR